MENRRISNGYPRRVGFDLGNEETGSIRLFVSQSCPLTLNDPERKGVNECYRKLNINEKAKCCGYYKGLRPFIEDEVVIVCACSVIR